MGKTILIVDDDTLVRKGLGSGLITNGFTVEEAADGKEGLAKALELHPDLIIADVHMPEMDGMAMIDQMRQDDWGKTVPVIVMSTDDSTATVNQALVSGVTIYLAKSSLTPDALVEQVKSSLG